MRLMAGAVSNLARCSSFFLGFDVRTIGSFRDAFNNLMNSRIHPKVVDEMNVRTVNKLTIGTTISAVPSKEVPNIRLSITDKEMENRSTGVLSKLLVKLTESLRCPHLVSGSIPKMVYVIVLENGCVEVSKGPTPDNHAGYVKVPENDFMTELNRYALFSYSEKLRKILGGTVFECLEKSVNHGGYSGSDFFNVLA